jgi:DNA-directed RNA polymerase specialized sigma24 family protein
VGGFVKVVMGSVWRGVAMGGDEGLAREFETHRVRPRSLAYRMLGSLNEADDAVQEAGCG